MLTWLVTGEEERGGEVGNWWTRVGGEEWAVPDGGVGIVGGGG